MSFTFDASQYDPSVGIDPYPAGWNPVVIVGHKPSANAKGNGGHLKLELKHQQTGKPAFIQLNLWHSESAQAVDIANKELSAIVHVTLGATQGRLNFNDPSELYNIPFQINNVPDEQGRNNFKGYRDAQGRDPKGGNAGQPSGQPSGPGMPQGQPPAGMPPAQTPPPMQQPPQGQPAQQWGPPQGQTPPPAQTPPQQAPAQQPGWGAPQGQPQQQQAPAQQPPAQQPQQPAPGNWGPPQGQPQGQPTSAPWGPPQG